MNVPPPSARGELARLALQTALAHPDVVGGRAGDGGACVSVVGGQRLEGVSAAAERGGQSYGLILCLSTRPVPLHALAAELRRRVAAAAVAAPLAGEPGSIEIQIVDVVAAEEVPR